MPARRVVVDHVTLPVSDLEASRRFYAAALAPLGFGEVWETADAVGFGAPGVDDFAICQGVPGQGGHVAFAADSRAEVEGFHAAALAAGAEDNGPPAPRPQYGPGYYAAFVLSPDGFNVEAVFHAPIVAG